MVKVHVPVIPDLSIARNLIASVCVTPGTSAVAIEKMALGEHETYESKTLRDFIYESNQGR